MTADHLRGMAGSYAAWLFKGADSDHDGTLTREEFPKQPIDSLFEVTNFNYLDVNKQGYGTQSDFVYRPNPAFAAFDHDKSCVSISFQPSHLRIARRGATTRFGAPPTMHLGQGEEVSAEQTYVRQRACILRGAADRHRSGSGLRQQREQGRQPQ